MESMLTIPAVKPRRPYDDKQPHGYQESLRDWVDNNTEAVEWFLTNADKLREEFEWLNKKIERYESKEDW